MTHLIDRSRRLRSRWNGSDPEKWGGTRKAYSSGGTSEGSSSRSIGDGPHFVVVVVIVGGGGGGGAVAFVAERPPATAAAVARSFPPTSIVAPSRRSSWSVGAMAFSADFLKKRSSRVGRYLP